MKILLICVIGLVCGCRAVERSNNNNPTTVGKYDWWESLQSNLVLDRKPFAACKGNVMILEPNKNLTIEMVRKSQLGEPEQIKKIVKREDEGCDRPVVWTLNIYENIVFVEHDYSAIPGTVVMIFMKYRR